MVIIMESRLTPGVGVRPSDIQKDMRRVGFTGVATALSLESLRRKGLIGYEDVHDENGFNSPFTHPICVLTLHGVDWMLANQERFKLRKKGEPLKFTDEGIPS